MFETVNGAVAEQSQTTGEMSDNAASTSRFIVSVGDSASEIGNVTKEAEAHGESVAKAGQAVTMFAQKLKSRCAVLLRQNEGTDRRKREKMPCSLRVEITTARGVITAPVYEISNEGILISGPDAERLAQHETVAATLQNVGACRIRIGERTKAGVLAQFERPDAALKEAIEDALWAIHDEKHPVRHPRHGSRRRADQDLRERHRQRCDLDRGHVRYRLCGNPGHQSGSAPHQGPRRGRPGAAGVPGSLPGQGSAHGVARPSSQRLSADPHDDSHPQRPGDAPGTPPTTNRRIFNDAAGLAAGRNQRAYMVQSYARDMGNGKAIMMREIRVPIPRQGPPLGRLPHRYKL